MFEFIRQHTRIALGFMLLLIIPSFVFFGVQGYQRSEGGDLETVATVDGKPITRGEWDAAHRRVVDNVRRQSPGIDASMLESPALRRESLDAMVRERLLLAAANQLNLFPTAARMNRLFDTDPQFSGLRGADGKISRELLAMQGMTPEMFDQRLRQEFGVKQVLAGISQTVPAAAAAASASLNAFLQRRQVEVERFDPAAYRSKVTASDAEVEAYYKANESQFAAPEQASIEYLVLDLDALTKGLTLTDDDLRKAYQETAARYTQPEERRASHILIKADKDKPAAERAQARARAEALLAQVRKAPATFAEVARKNSEDGSAAQGGDLDFFGRGAMVKPFEDTVFKLKVGEISDIVETDFGFHIITVTAQRGGQSRPFEEVRPEIEAELRKSRSQARWAEAAEQFTNMVYEQSDTLAPAVTKLGLEKRTATVQRKPAPGAAGALASTKLLDAVFATDAVRNKRNTDAIEVGPNQLVSARVLQHQPARTLPFAEVKERVRERVVADQALALARKEGEARLAALRGGSGAALGNALTVSRIESQSLPPALLDAAMGADPTALPAFVGVDLGAAGFAVMRVVAVLPRETPPGGDAALNAQYAQAWGAAEADAYLAALRKRFKAEIKPAASLAPDAAASSAAR